ncbi:uncharacterized protein LOC135104760 [Scylla paramamosain]|uniref:uncharacterized protein LOC135104760 n=1 Tax=Scylla paramamosain TaxID=85552 RepID=UPI003082F22D
MIVRVLLGCLCACSALAAAAPQSEYRVLSVKTQEVKTETPSEADIISDTIMSNLPSFLRLFYKIRHGIVSDDGSFDFNQTKSLIMDVVNIVSTIVNALQDNDTNQHSPRDLRTVEEIISFFLHLLQATNSQKQGNTNKTFIKDSTSIITEPVATADRSSASLQASSPLVDVLQDSQDSPVPPTSVRQSAVAPQQASPAPASRPGAKEVQSQMEADLATTTKLSQISASSAHPEAPNNRHFFLKDEYEHLTQISRHRANYPGYSVRLQI